MTSLDQPALVVPTPQLRLSWTKLSWSVLAECGKNEKGGQLTGVYLGEKTTFSWEWLINWFDRQQIPVVLWFDPQQIPYVFSLK